MAFQVVPYALVLSYIAVKCEVYFVLKIKVGQRLPIWITFKIQESTLTITKIHISISSNLCLEFYHVSGLKKEKKNHSIAWEESLGARVKTPNHTSYNNH